MKAIISSIASAAVAGAILTSASLTFAEPLVIGIVGDQTGAQNLDKAYQIMAQGVAALNQQPKSLDVVLHVGDLVESTQSVDDIAKRFKQAVGIMNGLTAPWYAVAGDHDVNPPQFQQDSSDRSREQLFMNLYSQINPKVGKQLYYSFDVKGYHFVMLYAIEHLDTDPRWGNVYYSAISDAQYQWLQQDLKTNAPGKSGVVVVVHQPMWYMWSNWERVHRLLSQYPVKAVIAGHYHYNQVQEPLDGIVYQIVGATGGDTKKGNPNSGELQHVTVLTIDSGSPNFEMIPLAPYAQAQWTPQRPMDRIQAIDTNLGNLWSLGQNSPVYLQNGKLVSACGSADPAKIVIKDIGNANAAPVNVSINVNGGPSVFVTSSQFGAGLCTSDIGPFECQLAPSAGVAVSNNSMVQMSAYPPPPPLWTGTLDVKGTAPAKGTTLTAQVIMSFVDNNQQFLVYQTGSTSVAACP